jgi:hypothetical protein
VAGWPGGKNFIDSSTLLLRMKLPSQLLNNGNIEIEEKSDEHEKMEEENVQNSKTGTSVNWENILPLYSKIEAENLFRCFLSRMPANEVMEKIKSDSSLPPKELILKIVSLPEYSLV